LPLVAYPPTDTLKAVADDIWIVDSGPVRAFGIALPVRMTVVRLPGGDLWLHSPTSCTPGLLGELQSLGAVRHLVAPNIAHWMMLASWQNACPAAVTWGVPGLSRRPQVRLSKTPIDREIEPETPPEWRNAFEQALIRGALGYCEAVFFHRPSRTLLLTDLVQNLEPAKLSLPARLLLQLAGSTAPDGRAPVYLRLAVQAQRREAAAAMRGMLALDPQRAIFAHGTWFAHDAGARLRRSLRWIIE